MAKSPRGAARFQPAVRNQIEWQPLALEDFVSADHPARLVWAYVESLDLSELYADIKAVEGSAGRDPIDPKILLALWLFGTLDGVGSARRLNRLCQEHLAYRWLCGGVSVNYHTLSDFRVQRVEFLDRLLTQSVAVLLHQGLVELKRVAQDGMRVRASAGASSFRRRESLEKCLAEAQAHLKELQQEAEGDGAAEERRVQAAQARAARERAQRLQQALAEREKLAAAQKEQKPKQPKQPKPSPKSEPAPQGPSPQGPSPQGPSPQGPSPQEEKTRASCTDPEARKMKMGDGGFRPAYNVPFATASGSQVIVGVEVTNAGTDGGQLQPMLEQLERRYQQRPQEYLADGSFVKLDDITAMEKEGTAAYLPIPGEEKKRAQGKDPFAPLRGDSVEVAAWRARMGTPEGQAIYRQRTATAEFPHATCRNRGLQQFNVRGILKAKAVSLWQALAHNLQRQWDLRRKGPWAAA